jgi:hypothetical protein
VNRYLFRVTYTLPDGAAAVPGTSTTYEPVCVRALTEAEALADVTTNTTRYMQAAAATRTITLVTVTADV